MRRLALALVAAALLAGCGASNKVPETPSGRSAGSGTAEPLVAATDVGRVLDAESAIDQLCLNQPVSTARLRQAVQTITDVYRLGPNHIFESGSDPHAMDMGTVVRQQSARLRRCGAPALAARLRSVLSQNA